MCVCVNKVLTCVCFASVRSETTREGSLSLVVSRMHFFGHIARSLKGGFAILSVWCSWQFFPFWKREAVFFLHCGHAIQSGGRAQDASVSHLHALFSLPFYCSERCAGIGSLPCGGFFVFFFKRPDAIPGWLSV